MSSNNLDKYEYLTGEDLGLKPSTVEQAKCEYSPLGKIFNKGLSEEDKKEGLLKKLKNIEDKNEQLKIKNKTENVKEVTDFIKEPLSQEAIDLIKEIKTIEKNVNYKKLSFTGGNKFAYDFSDFKTFSDLFNNLRFKKMSIDDAEMMQNEFNSNLNDLRKYSAREQEYIEAKNNLLENVNNFYKGRKIIIDGFKKGIFQFIYDDDGESKQQQTSKEPIKTDANAFNEWINKEETGINREIFENHFNFSSDMLKNVYKTNDKKKNKKIVRVINSGLKDKRRN